MNKVTQPLRKRIQTAAIKKTSTPVVIYIAVGLAIVIAIAIKPLHEELSLNLTSEMIAVAFIIFVVNILLVNSKNKQWKIVSNRMDYLIARNVNQIRDGVATFALGFNPELKKDLPVEQAMTEMRSQRDFHFQEWEALSQEEFAERIADNLFQDEQLEYFSHRAEQLWSLLNMKYSEYLAPELVSHLMDLHIQLSDLCAHIRSFKKASWFIEDSFYYQESGRRGAAHNLRTIIGLVSRLKKEGYSEIPRMPEIGQDA